MAGHRGDEVGLVRVPNDQMAGSLMDLKAIRFVETPKIVLAPSKRRPSHAVQQLLARIHKATLAPELSDENVSGWIQS
ncbi:MAG: hypothetical protein ACREF4_03065 [Gammaproteobacteria bacterium]